MSANAIGPTSNLPAHSRRQGRGGTVTRDGKMLGEITSVDWSVAANQVNVLIAGGWRDETIPGAEARTFTLSMQDVDDRWKLEVWRFFEARRQGDFTSQPQEFDLVTKLVGGPSETRWALYGCKLFGYDGGYNNADDLINRALQGTFASDKPLSAYEYADGGSIVITEG